MRRGQGRVLAAQADGGRLLQAAHEDVVRPGRPPGHAEGRAVGGVFLDRNGPWRVDDGAAGPQHPHVVQGGLLQQPDGVGLDRARVDAGPVRTLLAQVVEVRQQALPVGVDRLPGVLDAGGRDAVGQLPPRTLAIVRRQAIQGVGVHQAAPLHRPAEPDGRHPTRRAQDRDGAVRPHRARGRVHQIHQRHARPRPVPGLVEKVLVARQFVPQRVGLHEVGRGEDVRGMERHLPRLGAARHGVGELIERPQDAQALAH